MTRHSANSESAPTSDHAVPQLLVVEDEMLVRLVVCDALRDAGYQVIEAMNADEAVEILKSGADVDLIFSDVRMPGTIDGLGLLGFVTNAFPTLPVILTSGHLHPLPAFDGGAAAFLEKPYILERLLEVIQHELAKIP